MYVAHRRAGPIRHQSSPDGVETRLFILTPDTRLKPSPAYYCGMIPSLEMGRVGFAADRSAL